MGFKMASVLHGEMCADTFLYFGNPHKVTLTFISFHSRFLSERGSKVDVL